MENKHILHVYHLKEQSTHWNYIKNLKYNKIILLHDVHQLPGTHKMRSWRKKIDLCFNQSKLPMEYIKNVYIDPSNKSRAIIECTASYHTMHCFTRLQHYFNTILRQNDFHFLR
jgi:hypothetical protein